MNISMKQRGVGNLRKLVVVDDNNIPTGEIKLVRVEEVEGNVLTEGSPITREVLDSINWRDENIVFKNLNSNELPNALADKTQILSTLDGKVWIIPSLSSGASPFFLDTNASPCVKSVLEGNGLTLDDEGELKQNLVTETENGSISSTDYVKLKKFIDGAQLSNIDLATTNGLYYGTNVLNAPTTNPIVASVIKNGNKVSQTVIDQATNKTWVRVINNGTVGDWYSTSAGTVLYEGELTLNYTEIPNTEDLYDEGYRRIKIEVYWDETTSEEDYDNITYRRYGSVEMKLFDYNGVDNLYNYATILTSIQGGEIKYITVSNTMGEVIELTAYNLKVSTGTSSRENTSYNIKVIGYKE